MDVKIDSAEVEAAFAELSQRLTDFSPVMADIGELMIESTKQNFVEGSSPDGIPWAAKSQATIDAYKARGDTPNVRPLIGASKSLSTTIFAQSDAASVSWGSNMVYSGVMQFGAAAGEFGATIGRDKNGREFFTSTPWGNIPARPFLGIGADDQVAIIKTIEDWLVPSDGS